jgi:hypothetical protein
MHVLLKKFQSNNKLGRWRLSMESGERRLSIRDGMLAAFLGGAIGMIVPAIGVAAFAMGRWNHFLAEGDYRWWFYWYAVMAGPPMLGCATVFASTCWVAYSCKPASSIGASFVAVFLGTVAIWILLWTILPARNDSKQHPMMHPSDAALMVSGPMVTGAIITVFRCSRITRLTRRSS